MKSLNFIRILSLIAMITFSCGERSSAPKAVFGLYGTVRLCDIPPDITESLRIGGMQIVKDTLSAVIGYVQKNDITNIQAIVSKENFKLAKAGFTSDSEEGLSAIVAIKRDPELDNSDIQKTKSNGKNVEIYFNLEGARKWADMTRNSAGRQVAFVIDEMVYSLPLVNAEIKSGTALISGFEDELTARRISESLNK